MNNHTPQDPIDYCLEALNTGQNKAAALQHANNAFVNTYNMVNNYSRKLTGKGLIE